MSIEEVGLKTGATWHTKKRNLAAETFLVIQKWSDFDCQKFVPMIFEQEIPDVNIVSFFFRSHVNHSET